MVIASCHNVTLANQNKRQNVFVFIMKNSQFNVHGIESLLDKTDLQLSNRVN